MWKIVQGTVNLMGDEKGIMCVLILACATAATILGKMDGNGFAAACSVIGSIYCWTQHKENMNDANNNVQRPGFNPSEIITEVKKVL
jgi:hypothetical protein